MKNGKITNLTRIVARLTCFVVLLFSCPLFVHAEGTPLPYAPGQLSGYVISADELSALNSVVSSVDPTVNLYTDTCIIFKSGETTWYTYTDLVATPFYFIYVFSSNSPILPSEFSNPTGFPNFDLFTSNDYIDVNFSNTTGKKFTVRRTNLGSYYNNMYACDESSLSGIKRFYGDPTLSSVSNEFFEFEYNLQYPIYCKGSFQTIDLNSMRGTFLTNNLIPISPEDPEPIDPDFPRPDPQPQTPFPTFPTVPSNPTVENLLKWIGDCIVYFGTYFRQVMTSNVGAFLKSIRQSIEYGFKNLYSNFVAFFKPYFDIFLGRVDEIIVTLKNSFTSFLSLITDIKTALENVKKFFDYIVSIGSESGQFSLTTLFVNLFIPSSADINQAFIDTDSFALITFFKTAFNKVSSIWDSIVNASVKKSIHVNGFVFHGVTIPGFDIDFSWFDNVKSYSDVIISAFLIINYIWFIFFRAPSFIRGHSNMSGAVGGVIDNHDSKGNVT